MGKKGSTGGLKRVEETVPDITRREPVPRSFSEKGRKKGA